jgi:hypothetical protein
MIEVAVAFAAAQAAVAGVKQAIALGHEIQDCYHEIAGFFTAQGEIQAAAIEQAHNKKIGKVQSATAEAIDATFANRKMARMEIELREMLVYNSGNESGLYEEMCQRRDAIVLERKEALEEEARQERMRLRAIERKKQERIQLIQNCIAVVFGTAVSVAIMYGIWVMFHWRD